jgi:RND superfamily putative drug exporter
MTGLARLAAHHPWRLLVTFLVLTVFGLGLSGVVSGRLNDSLSQYQDPASGSAEAQAEVKAATGVDIQEGYTILVRLSAPASLEAPPPAAVTEAVRVLEQRPEVVRVTDAWSTGDPAMIASNGRNTIVVASLRPVKEVDAVHALQSTIDGDPLLTGSVLLGGSTALDAQGSDQSLQDLRLAETVAIPILLVLLVIFFRSVVAGLLPLLGAVVSIALASLGLLLATSVGSVSVYALNLVYALGFGLSIDFSLLIVSRYREEMRASGPGAEALTRTLNTAGRTVLFSASTVTCALAALLLFPITSISSMGLAGMLVTIGSAISAVVVLPAVLALLGPRIDSLSLLRRGGPLDGADSGWWAKLARAVMRRPLRIAIVVALVLLAVGSPALGVEFTGYTTKGLPEGLQSVQVDNILMSDYTSLSAAPLQLVITAGASQAAQVAAYAGSVAQVRGVVAVAKPEPLGSDLWEVDVTLRGASAISASSQNAAGAVERLPAPFPVKATGYTASFKDFESSVASHLPGAVLLLAATTLVILFVMTASVVLPVKALVMNMLTLGATLGLIVVAFQDGWLGGLLGFPSQGAINLMVPVLSGALAFGLSTDYGVFLLSRIREGYCGGLSTRDAVAMGLQRVGRVVTSAAVLFCIAVGALVVSQTVVLKEIGLAGALAVLIDSSIVRALLGRWNWWAPRWLARLHSRLGFDRLDAGASAVPAAPRADAARVRPAL